MRKSFYSNLKRQTFQIINHATSQPQNIRHTNLKFIFHTVAGNSQPLPSLLGGKTQSALNGSATTNQSVSQNFDLPSILAKSLWRKHEKESLLPEGQNPFVSRERHLEKVVFGALFILEGNFERRKTKRHFRQKKF